MSVLIESGVGLIPWGRQKAPETVAMETMEVGESFMVDDWHRWMFIRSRQCKMRPRKFAVRKVRGGWRVWRIE